MKVLYTPGKGTAVYGTVRTVVWEDGGGDPASYPILDNVPVSRYQRIGATNPFSEPFEASIGYS